MNLRNQYFHAGKLVARQKDTKGKTGQQHQRKDKEVKLRLDWIRCEKVKHFMGFGIEPSKRKG